MLTLTRGSSSQELLSYRRSMPPKTFVPAAHLTHSSPSQFTHHPPEIQAQFIPKPRWKYKTPEESWPSLWQKPQTTSAESSQVRPPLAENETYPATNFHTLPPQSPQTSKPNPPSDLTGTSPTPQPTLAGTTHPLPLTTPYYTATVPIWLDLVSDPSEWTASFLAPEAKEVLDALGGVVVVFDLATAAAADKAKSKALLEGVGHLVRTALGGWEWDGVLLAVGVEEEGVGGGVDEEDLEAWEDVCAEWGLEFIHHQRQGHGGKVLEEQEKRRNEYGERVGVARALEALQANDWASAGGGEGEGEEFGGFEEGDGEDVDMDMDFLGQGGREDFEGLRKAIWEAKEGGDGDEEMEDEEDVKKLERAMLKLQAVRDRGVGMTEEQRKRMAKQAVGEVMKEL